MISSYTLGSNAALIKLGFNPSSILKPVIGGAAFGGFSGAVASPEGHRAEGAMRGAFLGGALAGAGSAAGGAYKNIRSRLPVSATETMTAAEAAAKLNKSLGKTQTGLTMLGGVGGAGLGIAKTEQNARMTNEQDPYGYRYR